MEALYDTDNKFLTIKTKDDAKGIRENIHVCCVIDVSGSMFTQAVIQNENNESETTGLSVLDIILYSVRTVVKSLKPGDLVSIVQFASESTILLEYTDASEWGRIDSVLSTMKPTTMTNLWAGLEDGIKLTKKVPTTSSIFLFTDGIPNVDPPRGYGYELKKIGFDTTIHTFGFGYSINSEVLTTISKMGNGSFNYIPDAGMVGTTFIHAVANLLSQFAQDIIVNGKNIGTLRYGQPRHIYSETPIPEITYRDHDLNLQTVVVSVDYNIDSNKQNDRFVMIECLQQLFSGNEGTKIDIVNKAILEIKDSKYQEDLKKEVLAAVETSNYSRWGNYYLQSILNAHEQEYCNNFRDPGIQDYGIGNIFNTERDNAEVEFKKLPLPTPTHKSTYSFGSGGMASAFLNSNSGCFSGDSLIQTYDKSVVRVDSLVSGTELMDNEGGKVIVKFLVVTPEVDMISQPGYCITPWHPINIDGTWEFPAKLFKNPKIVRKKSYNIVLEWNMSFILGDGQGVGVVSLGHGNRDTEVLYHPYLSTESVLDDIFHAAAFTDSKNGIVVLDGFSRDPTTNLINGIKIPGYL